MKQGRFVLLTQVGYTLLVFCIFALCGCGSLVGFGIGAIVDGSKPDKDTLHVGGSVDLASGEEIRILLLDSTVVEGSYRQYAPLDSVVYDLRYKKFLDGAGDYGALPGIGDTLIVEINTGSQQYWYLFRGFGSGYIIVRRLDRPIISHQWFTNLASVRHPDGSSYDLQMFKMMDESARLPRDASLVVENKAGILRVPLDDIGFIEKQHSKNARLVGLGIGLAVDITAIIIWSGSDHSFGLGNLSLK